MRSAEGERWLERLNSNTERNHMRGRFHGKTQETA